MNKTAVIMLALFAAPHRVSAEETILKIMSFNIWGGGGNEGKDIDDTVAVLKKADADIIGLQETRLESNPCTAEHCPAAGPNAADALAEALGYYLYVQSGDNAALWANAILSRYPIVGATTNDLGVEIRVEDKKVFAFNIHPTDYPYQPYQLRHMPYGDAPYLNTAKQAEAAASAARGNAIDLLMRDLKVTGKADATFIFGDFNEPSCLDWTSRTVAAARHPVAVCYPTSKRILDAGFTDTFRAVYPDEVAKPGFTWSAVEHAELHDRIDFIYARGNGLQVTAAAIVGEKSPEADIVMTPWPSDHRAVTATVTFTTIN